MNAIKKAALILSVLLGLGQSALAQESQETYLVERNQSNCRSSDPGFSAWFFNQTSQVPRIHQILGPVRDQGQTLQCYALAAADMITAYANVRISGEQVAHLYYQKSFAGSFQRFFGNNQGGFIASAMGSTHGQGLCAENTPVTLAQDPDQRSERSFCQTPAINIRSLPVRGQTTNGVGRGHQLFPAMDRQLNKNKIVGASYRAQDIFVGFQVSAFNSFANHASTIVAKHWNPQTQSCDYVIRNTWGEGCRRAKGFCNRGYYSVSEKLIDQALQKIDYTK